MTNEQLQKALAALRELGQHRMPMAAAVRAANLQRRIQDHLGDVEQVRRRLVELHAPEGAEQITPQDEGWAAFVQAFTELMQAEAELEFGESLKLYVQGDVASFFSDLSNPLPGIQPNVIRDLAELLCFTELQEVEA